MPSTAQISTVGEWMVKPNMEDQFISLWTSFAEWTISYTHRTDCGYLLQDQSNPRRFISFGFWEDAESVSEWRSHPKFTKFVQYARELCTQLQPGSFNPVSIVESNR